MKDTRNKISTKGAKRSKSSNQNDVVDAGRSTSDKSENIDKPTDDIVNIEEKSPYVEVNINGQTSLICMLHIFQDKEGTDDDVEFTDSSSLSNKSEKVKVLSYHLYSF